MEEGGGVPDLSWVPDVNTGSILGDSRPDGVEALLKKSNRVWRDLYRAWLAARAPQENLQAFDFVASGGTADKNLRKQWVKTLDAGFGPFVSEVGELKDFIRNAKPKSSGGRAGDALGGLVREREAEAGGDSSQYGGAVRGLEEQVVQGNGVLKLRELASLKEEVHKVVGVVGETTTWKENGEALAVIQDALGAYRTAEGELRRITQDKSGLLTQAQQWRDQRQLNAARAAQLRQAGDELKAALDAWTNAGVELGEAVQQAAKMCWSWAQAEARENIRDAFSTVHDTTYNVLFACKRAVRAIQLTMHAAASVYPGANVAAGALGLAFEGVELLVKELMVRNDARDLDTVLDQGAGMKVVRKGDRETEEFAGEMASGGVELGLTASELGVKGAQLAGTIGEHSLHAAEIALPGVGIGVVLFQTGVDIYEFAKEKQSNPQIVQAVSDEEIAQVQATVRWAYDRKNQQDLDFGNVRYHGRDPGTGDYMVSVDGVFGTLGQDGFFVPSGQSAYDAHRRGFEAAVATAGRSRDDLPWDEIQFVDYDADRNCYMATLRQVGLSLWPEGVWQWDDLQQGTALVLTLTVPEMPEEVDLREGASDEEWEATEQV